MSDSVVTCRWASRLYFSRNFKIWCMCRRGTFVRAPLRLLLAFSFFLFSTFHFAFYILLCSSTSLLPSLCCFPFRWPPAIKKTVLDLSFSMGRFIFIPYDSFDWTWLVVTGTAIYFRYYESTFRPHSPASLLYSLHVSFLPACSLSTLVK